MKETKQGTTDGAKRKANAEGQARYREDQRRQGRTGRLIYLSDEEFRQVKHFIEMLRNQAAV